MRPCAAANPAIASRLQAHALVGRVALRSAAYISIMKKHILITIGCLVLVFALAGCAHTKPVVISIAPDGALAVAGRQCPPTQLVDRLTKVAERNPNGVVVRADPKAPMQQVVAVMDACKAAGIHDVNVTAK